MWIIPVVAVLGAVVVVVVVVVVVARTRGASSAGGPARAKADFNFKGYGVEANSTAESVQEAPAKGIEAEEIVSRGGNVQLVDTTGKGIGMKKIDSAAAVVATSTGPGPDHPKG